MTVLGGRTGARLFGMSKACCEPGSTGHHLGLHRGGDKDETTLPWPTDSQYDHMRQPSTCQ